MKKQIKVYLVAIVATCFVEVIWSPFYGLNFAVADKSIFPMASKLKDNNYSEKRAIVNNVVGSNQSDDKKKISSVTLKTEDKIPPMIDKHIFSPEPDTTADNSLVTTQVVNNVDKSSNDLQQNIDLLMQKAKKEIELTGIIITPSSKKAMILYKGKGSKKQEAQLYDAGSSIDDYLLKEVAPNYVIIAQNSQEIKLALFKERTNRPEPPKEVVNQSSSNKNPDEEAINKGITIKNPPDLNLPIKESSDNTPMPIPQKMINSNSSSNSFEKAIEDGNIPDISNPFIRAMHGAAMQGESSGDTFNINSSTDVNPFLQAIKRARERQQNQQ